MSSHTWACFPCRAAVRRKAGEPPRCAYCGKPCEDLGTKVPLPRKNDKDGWEAVQVHLKAIQADEKRMSGERVEHHKKAYAEQIAKLEALPPNKGRARTIKELRAKLAAVLLEEYGREPHEREVERVRAAIAALAGGDVKKTAYFVAVAKKDYRDVLLWSEEPEKARLSAEERERMRAALRRLGVEPPPGL